MTIKIKINLNILTRVKYKSPYTFHSIKILLKHVVFVIKVKKKRLMNKLSLFVHSNPGIVKIKFSRDRNFIFE